MTGAWGLICQVRGDALGPPVWPSVQCWWSRAPGQPRQPFLSGIELKEPTWLLATLVSLISSPFSPLPVQESFYFQYEISIEMKPFQGTYSDLT